jgi:hypothetical protein
MSLTRADLLGRSRRRVEVPVAGGVVILQAPTAGVWLEYSTYLSTLPEHSYEHVVRLVAITAVDDDGKPLLSDEDCRQLDYETMATLARAALAFTRTEAEVPKKQGES